MRDPDKKEILIVITNMAKSYFLPILNLKHYFPWLGHDNGRKEVFLRINYS